MSNNESLSPLCAIITSCFKLRHFTFKLRHSLFVACLDLAVTRKNLLDHSIDVTDDQTLC